MQGTGRGPFRSSKWYVARNFLPTANIPNTWQSLLSFDARSPVANAQVQYRHVRTGGTQNQQERCLNPGGSGLGRHGHWDFLGGCLRRHFGDQLFPVATFLETGVNGADLGALLDDEWRAALRAGLRDGHVRGGEIAIRIARAAVENARASATALAGAAPADEFAFIALRAFNAHGDWPRVLALRIAGAADELAEAAVFFHEAVAAKSALFVQRLIGLVRDARTLHQPACSLAIGVTHASEERAEAAALDGHFLAAIVTI